MLHFSIPEWRGNLLIEELDDRPHAECGQYRAYSVKSKFVCKILQVQCHVLHRDAMHPLVTRLHAGGSSQGCTAPLRGSLDGFRSACHKSVML